MQCADATGPKYKQAPFACTGLEFQLSRVQHTYQVLGILLGRYSCGKSPRRTPSRPSEKTARRGRVRTRHLAPGQKSALFDGAGSTRDASRTMHRGLLAVDMFTSRHTIWRRVVFFVMVLQRKAKRRWDLTCKRTCRLCTVDRLQVDATSMHSRLDTDPSVRRTEYWEVVRLKWRSVSCPTGPHVFRSLARSVLSRFSRSSAPRPAKISRYDARPCVVASAYTVWRQAVGKSGIRKHAGRDPGKGLMHVRRRWL